MSPEDLEKSLNHLSFLGFDTSVAKEATESGKDVYFATHPSKSNMVLFAFSPGLTLVRSNITGHQPITNEMYAFINELNGTMPLVKAYLYKGDEDVACVRFDAVYQ